MSDSKRLFCRVIVRAFSYFDWRQTIDRHFFKAKLGSIIAYIYGEHVDDAVVSALTNTYAYVSIVDHA